MDCAEACRAIYLCLQGLVVVSRAMGEYTRNEASGSDCEVGIYVYASG